MVTSSVDSRITGSYSLMVAAAPEDLTCEDLVSLAASPITTAQQLGAGDCSDGSVFTDRLIVGLPPNASITASMISAAFQPFIELTDATTNIVVATAQGAASIAFTNGGAPKPYYLSLTSHASGGTGAYTLSVSILYPQPSAAASRLPSSDARLVRGCDGAPARVAGSSSVGWSRSP